MDRTELHTHPADTLRTAGAAGTAAAGHREPARITVAETQSGTETARETAPVVASAANPETETAPRTVRGVSGKPMQAGQTAQAEQAAQAGRPAHAQQTGKAEQSAQVGQAGQKAQTLQAAGPERGAARNDPATRHHPAATAAIAPSPRQTDTLAAVRTADRAQWPFPVYGTADTLRMVLARDSAPTPSVTASAEAVFGPYATLAEPLPPAPGQPQSLTDNAVFQGFVLLLAAAYALLLYYNLGDIRALLSRISRDTASGKRLFEDPAGSGFMRFLNTASAIGMLFLGVLAVKYGDALMPPMLLDMLPHGAVLALSLLATAACLGVILYQRAAMRLAGAVTLAQPFTAQLQLLRRTYFALAVVVISPALLLFALCPRGTGEVWFLLIVIELAVTVILYLREALSLFLSKKISILHWFLYLCAVEVFPISFLWLIAVR